MTLGKRSKWLLGLAGTALVAVVGSLAWLIPSGLWLGDYASYVEQRRGSIRMDTLTSETDSEGVEWVEYLTDDQLPVKLGIRVATEANRDHRVMILLGGLTRGRNAMELIPPHPNLSVVTVDYPGFGGISLRGTEYLTRMKDLISSLHDMAPTLSSALDYIETREELNNAPTELVGVSLGAILVCIAGGLDARFDRVWSVHGGGNVPDLLRAAGHRVRPGWVREGLVQGVSLTLRDLSPEDYVGRIAPRPFVMISASADDHIPRSCVELLYAKAKEPKELIWMETQHVSSRRPDVIASLVDEVLSRMLMGPELPSPTIEIPDH